MRHHSVFTVTAISMIYTQVSGAVRGRGQWACFQMGAHTGHILITIYHRRPGYRIRPNFRLMLNAAYSCPSSM